MKSEIKIKKIRNITTEREIGSTNIGKNWN